MGTGVSILLLAAGAILTFALEVEVDVVDLDVVGIILMIVGLIGLAISIVTVSGGLGQRPAVTQERYDADPMRRPAPRDGL